jgi:phosphatidylinositol alpha 1,6-mannosyltransferase
MRILFCSDTYPPQVNGVSVVTAISVAGLQSRGWECAVVAPRYPAASPSVFTEARTGGESVLESVPSVAMPRYPDIRLAAPSYPAIARLVQRFQPHLVHSETEFMLGRLGQMAGGRAGLPLVSSYHTDFARYAAAYGIPWMRGPISRYIARFHRRSRRTYTPSQPAREDLLRNGAGDVEVWGRGVDIAAYHPRYRSGAWRERLAIGDRFAYVYVGRLAAEKRVEHIIRAYAIAQSGLPPDSTRLVIAGAGPQERALRAAAPPGTIFLGYLDRRAELPMLYASSDAFVFGSLTETLGLVVLEAMASGLPVIAVPAGGVADHLHHGVNGLAVPATDVRAMAAAMVTIASNRAQTCRLAAGARATAEALSWERELDRLDASYREVVSAAS